MFRPVPVTETTRVLSRVRKYSLNDLVTFSFNRVRKAKFFVYSEKLLQHLRPCETRVSGRRHLHIQHGDNSVPPPCAVGAHRLVRDSARLCGSCASEFRFARAGEFLPNDVASGNAHLEFLGSAVFWSCDATQFISESRGLVRLKALTTGVSIKKGAELPEQLDVLG